MKLHAPWHHDQKQNQRRMKFLRIVSGCPEGARKWAHLKVLLCFCIANKLLRTAILAIPGSFFFGSEPA